MSEFTHLLVLHKLVYRGGRPSSLCGRFQVRPEQLRQDDDDVTCLRCRKRLERNLATLQLWACQESRRMATASREPIQLCRLSRLPVFEGSCPRCYPSHCEATFIDDDKPF